MKCSLCGGPMEATDTDMPFKIGAKRIVIFKAVPVLQCGCCGEYLIEDPVMARVDRMLAAADARAGLEIISYAA
jgi:YgiT-type zinc finger domain-containing protein